ncbi:MAG: hypothetical protein ACOYOS_00205 [Syntrophales bacterium]
MHETINSGLSCLDGVAIGSRLSSRLTESLVLEGSSAVTGSAWETWAFNGKTFEPSIYSGFSFNSYAVEDGVTYAAREEGIYVLDGTTDAGVAIHSGVVLSPSMFGTNNRKRFRNGFFDIEGAAPIVRGEVGGVGVNIPILHSKAMFPRALVGNKWTFLIADFDELGKVELFTVVLTR